MTDLRLGLFGSSTALDGGSECCLFRMAKYFHTKFQVTLFLPDEGPLYGAAQSCGLEVVSLNFLRLRRHRGTDWLRWSRSVLRARHQLSKIICEKGIQVVHFNDFIDLPFYTVPHKLKVPSLCHLRLIVQNPLIRQLYLDQVSRAGCLVVPVSGAVRDMVLGNNSTVPHHVLHDPCPDQTFFHPAVEGDQEREKLRESMGWKEGQIGVVMVSKLLENKGHLDFIRVAKSLLSREPDRYRFLMIAGEAQHRSKYLEQVQKRVDQFTQGVFTWIKGVPHQEVGGYLRAGDIFLHLPGTEDSFPGVVLEAMACQLPVIAYRVGGIPEQLDQGHAGRLCQPGDVQGVCEAVEQLSRNSDYKKELAEKGYQRVSQTFSASHHFKALNAIYRSLIGQPPRSESHG